MTKLTKLIFCLSSIFIITEASAANFQCEKVFSPELQIPKVSYCNSSTIPPIDDKKSYNFKNELYALTLSSNNLGGISVTFPNGVKKNVYRSAFLIGAPRCIDSLANEAKVKTVINFYSGSLGFNTEARALEQAIYNNSGVQNYIYIHDYQTNDYNPSPEYAKQINAKIVAIIKKIQNSPGNVLIHCETGEHNTGVIFGVLNKCFNHQSPESIQKNTICHIKDNSSYGKKTASNVLALIDQFPCNLLN